MDSIIIFIEKIGEIITKDEDNNLHFNYDINKSYINIIKKLAASFIKNIDSYEVDDTTIYIEGDEISDFEQDLPLSLWIINKIKESIIEGKYEINGEEIIITSVKSSNTPIDYIVKVNTIYETAEKKVKRTFKNLDLENKKSFKLVGRLLLTQIDEFTTKKSRKL